MSQPPMDQPPMDRPTGMSGSGVPPSTAGTGARFLARLLDGLLVFIPVSIVLALLGFANPFADFGGMDSWTWNIVTSLLWFGYYVYFESNGGATLGKRMLNLRVIDAAGRDPSTAAAAKRNLWMLFGLIPIVGGLAQFIAVIVIAVTISSNDYHRGKHDEIAGTAVMAG